MSSNFGVLGALLSGFVDVKRVVKILHTCGAIIHEVSKFKARFFLGFFLVKSHLEVAEGHLLVEIKLVNLKSTLLRTLFTLRSIVDLLSELSD